MTPRELLVEVAKLDEEILDKDIIVTGSIHVSRNLFVEIVSNLENLEISRGRAVLKLKTEKLK